MHMNTTCTPTTATTSKLHYQHILWTEQYQDLASACIICVVLYIIVSSTLKNVASNII